MNTTNLFIPCDQVGCNRKYKTEKSWLRHLQKDHQIETPSNIPAKIEYSKNNKSRNNQSIIQESTLLKKLELENQIKKEKEYLEMKNQLELKYKQELEIKTNKENEKIKQHQSERNKLIQKIKKMSQNSIVDNSNNICKICFADSAIMATMPCGHLCMCFKCAVEYETNYKSKGCIICRNEITSFQKVFIC